MKLLRNWDDAFTAQAGKATEGDWNLKQSLGQCHLYSAPRLPGEGNARATDQQAPGRRGRGARKGAVHNWKVKVVKGKLLPAGESEDVEESSGSSELVFVLRCPLLPSRCALGNLPRIPVEISARTLQPSDGHGPWRVVARKTKHQKQTTTPMGQQIFGPRTKSVKMGQN